MTTIGGALPADFLRAQLTRRLVPGSVIKIKAMMDDGEVKEKRYVVLSVSATTVCCVINSEMNKFVQTRPALRRNHIAMAVATHTFMKRDSFVDCTQTKVFATSSVLQELMAQTDWMLGNITPELRDEIVTVLQTSSTISPRDAGPLCDALKSVS